MNKIISTCIEIVLILSVSCAIGAIYNGQSEQGLQWTQKLYRSSVKQPANEPPVNPDKNPINHTTANNDQQQTDTTDQQEIPEVKTEGPTHSMQSASYEDASDFHSMGAPIVAFIDARSKENYDELRIEGAYHLYLAQASRMIEDIRPDIEMADFIIVYCNGGDCEDSITLAEALVNDYGFNYDSVYVYEGGLKEWKENNQPLEGEQANGDE